MSIAIIGTGSVGAALGERLTACSQTIVFGTRDPGAAGPLLERCQGRARAATVAEACRDAEVIFLAVPFEVVVANLESVRDAGVDLRGKVLVDCTNPLTWDAGPVWAPPAEGSMTAALAAAIPEASVIKGFATFGAAFHRDPEIDGSPVDVHLAGDEGAKSVVTKIARRAGFSPVDAGPLRNAAVLENLAILWIHLARNGYGRSFAFQMADRGDASSAVPGDVPK